MMRGGEIREGDIMSMVEEEARIGQPSSGQGTADGV